MLALDANSSAPLCELDVAICVTNWMPPLCLAISGERKKRLNYSTSKTLVNDPVVDLGWIRVDWTIALECLINEHVFCIPLAQFECGVCSCRIRRSGGQEESSRRTDGAAYRSG